MLKIALIILNWENAPATVSCAVSVLDEMKRCDEGIQCQLSIVDNGSANHVVKVLKDWVTQTNDVTVSLIENPDNLGFSVCMNSGISAAARNDQFDYFWLLNNDSFVVRFIFLEVTLIVTVNNVAIIAIAYAMLVSSSRNRAISGAIASVIKAIDELIFADSVVTAPAHMPARTNAGKTWCAILCSGKSHIAVEPHRAPEVMLVANVIECQ